MHQAHVHRPGLGLHGTSVATSQYLCQHKVESSCRISPLGQRFVQKWGSLRTAAAGAAILLMWADLPATMQLRDMVLPHDARRAAVKQLHYILGDNDRGSYVVGFGTNPPKRNHHRDAAMAPWEQNASPDAANQCAHHCFLQRNIWLSHIGCSNNSYQTVCCFPNGACSVQLMM